MKDKTIVKIAGIASITAMEISAMALLHIDGVLLSATVGTVAGIVGYQYGMKR